MTIKGMLANHVPGPKGRGAGRLPMPLPAGQIPTEDSRLWLFVPKSIQAGEAFIQDDTREWFEDRDRKAPISREYLDHPRWVLGTAANSVRAQVHNAEIVSEIHILVRITRGMTEYPAWVPARMTLKQQQADLAYRLTKEARTVFLNYGRQAMKDFAERAPAQFVKFVANTFIPKKVEVETPSGTMDGEQADRLLEALNAELDRRATEAKVISKANVLDYQHEADPVDGLKQAGIDFHEAAKDTAVGNSKDAKADIFYHVRDVVDIMTPSDAADIEWD